MRKFNCYFWVSLFAISFCSLAPACAANKIYPLDTFYAIVADDADWSCETSSNTNSLLGLSSNQKYIIGKAKYLPISFEFFHAPNHTSNEFENAKLFLSNYAAKTSTIFSGLKIDSSMNGVNIVRGAYFNNITTGRFAIYIKNIKQFRYYMFVRMTGDLLDDQTIEHLNQETFKLITPLIN